MKSLVTLVLLGCLAVAAVTYAKPQDGNQVFAPAPHNPRDCYCQCSGLGFTDGSGVRHGNCRTTDNGAAWCYVDRRNRRCPDLRDSQKYPGQQWSTHACATPARTDPICTGLIVDYTPSPRANEDANEV